jgi:hypothetical protein
MWNAVLFESKDRDVFCNQLLYKQIQRIVLYTAYLPDGLRASQMNEHNYPDRAEPKNG